MQQFCYYHCKDEEFPNEDKPVFCDECGHVYKSKRYLTNQYRLLYWYLWNIDRKRLSYLWRAVFLPKNKIKVCLLCSHPFRLKVP